MEKSLDDEIKEEAAGAKDELSEGKDPKQKPEGDSGENSEESPGVNQNKNRQDSDNKPKPEDKDDQDDSDQADAASEDPGKKGIFGRKKKDKDKRDQQIEDLTDRVQRQMAEFDNYRKRTDKEKASMFDMGARSVLEKILPTVDNFERGLSGLSDEQKEDSFVQGMEKVYRQLLTTLENFDVKPFDSLGQPFDPNFHNAVMHVEDEESGENIVVEEFQKGYMYHDNVLRHSMVKVAN